jgi:nitroimidazol reductase NimA-like FMN-containing flavoprotein (pyridoxamine 5'-phosphate oxidase superfamily)
MVAKWTSVVQVPTATVAEKAYPLSAISTKKASQENVKPRVGCIDVPPYELFAPGWSSVMVDGAARTGEDYIAKAGSTQLASLLGSGASMKVTALSRTSEISLNFHR